MNGRPLFWLWALTLVALGVAACSPDSGSTSLEAQVDPVEPGTVLSALDIEEIDLEDDFDYESAPSPMDQLFGDQVSPDQLEQLARVASAGFADFKESCMKTAGFSWYVEAAEPVPTGSYEARRTTDGLGEDGYGPVAHLFRLLDLSQGRAEVSEVERQRAVFESEMTAGERDAYVQEVIRCETEARVAHPPPGTGASAIDGEVVTDIDRVLQEIRNDPGFSVLTAIWAACMRSSGFDYDSRPAIAQELWSTGALIEQKILQPGPSTATGDIVSEVDALAQKESDILAADLACSSETRYDSLWAQLQHKLEVEAVSVNGDRWTLLLNSDG